MTVLIIDDDANVVSTFAEWLSAAGYQIRTAANGAAALDAIPGVDAVIVDARMPVLDGLGFVRELRGRNSAVAVAMITGDYLIDDSTIKECEALNTRIVFKPVWLDELTDIVGQLTAAGRCQ